MKSIVSLLIFISFIFMVAVQAADEKWSHVELAYADEEKFDQVSNKLII